MSGPQTEAGRELFDHMRSWFDDASDELILAIEHEAVAAFLASPEAAEGLARAMHEQLGHAALSLMCCDRLAAAVLAAWLSAIQQGQERAK